MTNESFQALLRALLDSFPDETLRTGQRLRQRQAEVLNAVIVELKARES